jgi:hypothetical protein
MHACLVPIYRVNVRLGPKEERVLITGLHTVADIHCTCCATVLGWKYVSGGTELDCAERLNIDLYIRLL